MTPGALIPYRKLMHIEVTGGTGIGGVFKLERAMALPAINLAVLAFQSKSGRSMFKRDRVGNDGPAVGGVAGGAVNLKAFTMWRLTHGRRHDQKVNYSTHE